jgi:DNA/RNA endonuclease G (NUC1)
MTKIVMLLFLAASYKPIELDPSYHHDKYGTAPRDVVRAFKAYTVSFDSNDQDICLGIPEFVAYQIKPHKEPLGKGPARPSKWIHSDGSPPDESYKNSGYDRGHLCQKYHAWRLGACADWNTHTTLNACPQLPSFNRGIWLDLENKCAEWADEFGPIWIITGPIVFQNHEWIGDEGEVPVAIPGAFFKIIVREPLEVIALLYPHREGSQKGPYNHSRYLVSVDYIELLTGLDFLTILPDKVEDRVEAYPARHVWGEDVYMMQRKK